jgi:hypothetical protein
VRVKVIPGISAYMENNLAKPNFIPDHTWSHDTLLTRKEAAAYLRITEATLAVWACTQRYALPFIKVGSTVRYRWGDLQGFLAARQSD